MNKFFLILEKKKKIFIKKKKSMRRQPKLKVEVFGDTRKKYERPELAGNHAPHKIIHELFHRSNREGLLPHTYEECVNGDDPRACIERIENRADEIQREKQVEDRRTRDHLGSILTHRTALAKKHLDRARQMYWLGDANMKKAMEEQVQQNDDANFSRIKGLLQFAKAQQYTTWDSIAVAKMHADGIHVRCELADCVNAGNIDLPRDFVEEGFPLFDAETAALSQRPWHLTKNALKELYLAYRHIRSYELNPHPPLVDLGGGRIGPNPQRTEEDDVYVKMMGTVRLFPNRLGIGQEAREVWKRRGIVDPNFLSSEHLLDFSSKERRKRGNLEPLMRENFRFDDENDYPSSRLYMQVLENDDRGPAMIHGLSKNMFTWDANADLVDEITMLEFWPDMAHALYNVHTHFGPFPPISDVYSDPDAQEDQNLCPWNEPEDRNYDDTVILQWEENQRQVRLSESPGWQGVLFTEDRNDRLKQAMLNPPGLLDGQAAVPGQILGQVQKGKKTVPITAVFYPTGVSMDGSGFPPMQILDSPDPELGLPSADKWDARVAAHMLMTDKRHLENVLLNMQKETWRKKMVKERGDDPDFQPPGAPDIPLWPKGPRWKLGETGQKAQGFGRGDTGGDQDNPLFGQLNVPELPRVQSIPRDAGELSFQGSEHVDFETALKTLPMPRFTEEQGKRMLQHALYILNAPATPWMIAHLPEDLNTGNILNHPLRLGEGQFRRDDMNLPGWAHFNFQRVPPPVPFLPLAMRKKRTRNQPRGMVLEGEQVETPTDVVWSAQVIGPLTLNMNFASDEPPLYVSNVFVCRTNQTLVLNMETWGLDFYHFA
jgi:hypothetical protein